MATVTICGASDDRVEVDILGEDGRSDFEADAFDRGRSIFLRLADGAGMRVYAEYSPDRSWWRCLDDRCCAAW